jgi:hypothetical protein
MLLSRGRASVRFVIFGDKNARVDVTASQPSPSINLSEASLGQSGSSVDCIPRKEIVSEDTAPTYSSTTRAVYLLNRSHSSAVGVLTTR